MEKERPQIEIPESGGVTAPELKKRQTLDLKM